MSDEVPSHEFFGIAQTKVGPLPIFVFRKLNALRRYRLGEPANHSPSVLNFHLMDKFPILAVPRITQNEGTVVIVSRASEKRIEKPMRWAPTV